MIETQIGFMLYHYKHLKIVYLRILTVDVLFQESSTSFFCKIPLRL